MLCVRCQHIKQTNNNNNNANSNNYNNDNHNNDDDDDTVNNATNDNNANNNANNNVNNNDDDDDDWLIDCFKSSDDDDDDDIVVVVIIIIVIVINHFPTARIYPKPLTNSTENNKRPQTSTRYSVDNNSVKCNTKGYIYGYTHKSNSTRSVEPSKIKDQSCQPKQSVVIVNLSLQISISPVASSNPRFLLCGSNALCKQVLLALVL